MAGFIECPLKMLNALKYFIHAAAGHHTGRTGCKAHMRWRIEVTTRI